MSPSYKLAKRYLPKGPGAVFTFGVKGGYEAGVKLVENVRLFSHLANIGDTLYDSHNGLDLERLNRVKFTTPRVC